MEPQKTKLDKGILRRKNKMKSITIPDFKLDYNYRYQNSMVLAQNKYTGQWNESGAKKKIPCVYDLLVFVKVAKIIQCGKDSLFNKQC